MSRRDGGFKKPSPRRTSSTDRNGRATRFRAASVNISSGSRAPSMWMCSSALGSPWRNASIALPHHVPEDPEEVHPQEFPQFPLVEAAAGQVDGEVGPVSEVVVPREVELRGEAVLLEPEPRPVERTGA